MNNRDLMSNKPTQTPKPCPSCVAKAASFNKIAKLLNFRPNVKKS